MLFPNDNTFVCDIRQGTTTYSLFLFLGTVQDRVKIRFDLLLSNVFEKQSDYRHERIRASL